MTGPSAFSRQPAPLPVRPATERVEPQTTSAALEQPRRIEQRANERIRLLLRAGKLRTPAGEFLCILRDVSDRGVKVRMFHPVPADHGLELELGSGEHFRIGLVWQRGDYAGFRFIDGPIAVQRLIEDASQLPRRHLRLRLGRPVTVLLECAGLMLPAQLSDLSQHGAAVVLERRLAIGQPVRIEAPLLPGLHARICWRRGRLHGVVFQAGFRLEALAELAAQLQLGPALPEAALTDAKSTPALTTD